MNLPETASEWFEDDPRIHKAAARLAKDGLMEPIPIEDITNNSGEVL
jgi:hypothetical protein